MSRFRAAVATCATIFSLCGLTGAQEEGKKDPPPGSVGGIEAAGSGSITGIVKFEGRKPRVRPMTELNANPYCKDCHKDGLPPRRNALFGTNGKTVTLQNVLVYVSGGLEGKSFEPPKTHVLLDQVGCLYTPHVVSVMAGQTLKIRNSDPVLHNVMTMPNLNRGFNVGMATKGDSIDRVFRTPEKKIKLRCVLHPWMHAYVHVMPHPFHAVTRADGTFTLP